MFFSLRVVLLARAYVTHNTLPRCCRSHRVPHTPVRAYPLPARPTPPSLPAKRSEFLRDLHPALLANRFYPLTPGAHRERIALRLSYAATRVRL